jgi:DNA-binding CsgD family transcriptional regulator
MANDDSNALNKIANLLALQTVAEMSREEQVRALDASGFSNAEVAGILGINPTTVRTTLHRVRKKNDGK